MRFYSTAWCALSCFAAASFAAEPTILGKAPMCEASAALRIPCGKQDCLLVGDNEVRDRLYRFSLEDDDIAEPAGQEIDLGDVEISDIEGLAHLSGNRVLVMGSQGRNKVCDPKKDRRRFVVLELSAAEVHTVGSVVQTKKPTCKRLFGATRDDGAVLKAVCRSIRDAEKAADAAFDALESIGEAAAESACAAAAPFNIEAVSAIPQGEGKSTWVGLRGPLVVERQRGGERRLAMMLRMSGLSKLMFDAAVLLDLDGFGIRELSVAGGWVWGVAGPPQDSDQPFRLWRFPIASLTPNATIVPEILTDLPTSSEGLALLGGTAFIIIDGDEGVGRCSTPTLYLRLRVPNY